MPTYEFRCPEGHVSTEWMQISKAVEAIHCHTCSAMAARLIGAGSPPIFKGSGFYATDYRKGPPAK